MNMDFLRKMTSENFVVDQEVLQAAQQIKKVEQVADIISNHSGEMISEAVIEKELKKKEAKSKVNLVENDDFFDEMDIPVQKKKIVPKNTYKETKFDDSKFSLSFVKEKLVENTKPESIDVVPLDAIKAMMEGNLSKAKEYITPVKETPKQILKENKKQYSFEQETEQEEEVYTPNKNKLNIKEEVKDCVYDILFDEILSKDRIRKIIQETMKEEIEKGVKMELQRLLSKKKS